MPIPDQPRRVREALGELRSRLERRWGPDLVSLRLFGSRARGQADAASDVDVAVVLERCGFDEKRAVIDAATDVGLEHDLLISPTCFDRETYERWKHQGRPLVRSIEQEGVPL